MNNENNPLDFLKKNDVNLEIVKEYLQTQGYAVHTLTQPGRHVVGKISKDNKNYFFKMASREALSIYIQNEYAWNNVLRKQAEINNWIIGIPQVFSLGSMGELSLSTMEYIEGVNGEDYPAILDSTINPLAVMMKDILSVQLQQKMPLDKQNEQKSLEENIKEKLIFYQEKIGRNHIDQKIISFLDNHLSSLQKAPARGDIGPGNILQDTKGKLWLIDAEFASGNQVKFYDIGYYYFRLAVNGKRIDLAERFLQEFLKLYTLTEDDKTSFKFVCYYRLLGGYFESLENPSLLPQIKKLEKVILNWQQNFAKNQNY